MKQTCFLLAAELMCQAALFAQTQPGVTAFQQADSLSALRGGRGGSAPIPRGETGKPFSAMATTRTSQTYLDGTNVSQTTAMMQYRDGEGRVRTETRKPGVSSFESESIVISDPVAGVAYRLDPAKKTAVKLAMARPTGVASTKTAAVKGGRGGSAPGSNSDTAAQGPERLAALSEELRAAEELIAAMTQVKNPNRIVEDLGTIAINGVLARGTRITTVVPAGAIGNDREFRSVSERWFSPDLNLLVKSVSTDPRFGTTTYELTNISRLPPDPYLFQVPADYTSVP